MFVRSMCTGCKTPPNGFPFLVFPLSPGSCCAKGGKRPMPSHVVKTV